MSEDIIFEDGDVGFEDGDVTFAKEGEEENCYLDAQLYQSGSITLSLDALIQGKQEVFLDGHVFKRTQLTVSADALLNAEKTLTVNLDALINKAATLQADLSALLNKENQTGSVILDAQLSAPLPAVQLDFDAKLSKSSLTGSTVLDAITVAGERVVVDAKLNKPSTTSTVPLDAVIADFVGNTAAVYLDAHVVISKREVKLHAILDAAGTRTLALDAAIAGPCDIWLDAILVATDRSHKWVNLKVRPQTFRNAIFSQDA